MKQAYKDIRFNRSTLELINFLDKLIGEYQAAGYTLSVRQLYYQLVARNVVPNTEQSYKRVASIINDARLAGMLDWDAVEDRNRDVQVRPRWSSGSDILMGCARQFHMDLWDSQDHRVFVIVEKAALAGILEPTCRQYDVPLLAARGYPSVSIVREMALDHVQAAINNGQRTLILHLGDHDPSGIDMTRDLEERFTLFLGGYTPEFELRRIALTRDQVDEQKPPPNPAKTTDSRYFSYRDEHGSESWELDALKPDYIVGLVRGEIEENIDFDAWDRRKTEIADVKTELGTVARDFERKGL